MVQSNQQGFPQITAPLVDPNTGNIQQVWLQLLINLWNRTGGGSGGMSGPITNVSIGTSPFAYTASVAGNLWISPGTYSDVKLTRLGVTLDFGKVTRGIFPMSLGDTITITYTTLPPAIYFI